MDASEIDMTEIMNTVTEASGLDENNVKIGVEMNEAGEVVRVIVDATGKEAAKTLEVAVKECSQDSNEMRAECQLFLKNVRQAKVVKNEKELSGTEIEKPVNIIFSQASSSGLGPVCSFDSSSFFLFFLFLLFFLRIVLLIDLFQIFFEIFYLI